MTDYNKLHDAQSIAWEWGQGVTDAETAIRKLHKLFPIDGVRAEKVEPVEWIKCADTLPTPHKDYWLCIEGAKFATIGRLNHQFNEDLYWCLENGNKGNDLPYAEVTHYAEIVRPNLPALPEDK